MKQIVSASLGSSKRNHQAKVKLLGEELSIERIGTDGDINRAMEMLKELDGKVDAIGLGGIDLYLYADGKRYVIRDAQKLKNAVKGTPVVDGSGLKDTLERETIRYLVEEAGLPLADKSVLMVSAVDRFGMAEAFHELGCNMIFGDLIFGLNLPVPIRTMRSFTLLAKMILPVVTRMPFKILYPTGSKQEKESNDKYARFYQESDIIAGDYLFIRKYIPRDMRGKWIITNTTTEQDVADLRERGVELLVTTTPVFDGRSFGTNVLEAALLALLGKKWEEVTPQDYRDLLKRLNYKPRIERLHVNQ
ncbi:MAG TPA: quinate 5-dehydrogenase [Anaerolineae bacterium]|nr:quinate 5-dehydrogenase [Anaerolineae bacterium]